MNLTPFQRKVLRIYWRYHTEGFNAAEVMRVNWSRWAGLVILAVVAYLLLRPLSLPLACLAEGLFVGAVIRDFGYLRMHFRMWPVNHEIYDWKKVSELIELHEKDLA